MIPVPGSFVAPRISLMPPARPLHRIAACALLAAALLALPVSDGAAACSHLRADIAPGILDTGTSPPTLRVTGDGSVDVADVVVALRATVHLENVEWDVADPTCPVPGDVAPGRLDGSTSPASWFPRGDSSLDLGDVVALLRIAVGLAVVDERLTYYRDTKSIIDAKCGGCHVAGGVGPFPLTTWDEVEPNALAIGGAVTDGIMPPWPPDESCAQYEHSRALTPAQRATLLDWIAQGALRGDPLDEPPPPPPPPVITFDLTLPMAEPYTPDPSLADDYRCFVLDWPPASTTYVNAVRVQPGVGQMVHHVIAYIADPSMVPTALANDANDPGPGYTCFGGPGGNMRWLSAWVPGSTGGEFAAGTGIRVASGSKIVMQVHYNMDYVPSQPDLSVLKLRTVSSVPRPAGVALLPAAGFFIPAGNPSVTYSLPVPAAQLADQVRGEIGGTAADPFVLHDVGHHMHQLGAWGRIRVARAAGGNTCLIDIPEWDFHWQDAYRLAPSVTLQAADIATITCNWDNSPANQPWVGGVQQDPVDVMWGEGSRDEMCLGIFYITAP